MSSSFYSKAKEGQSATLRLWRDEVVGVEVMGDAQWFLPKSGAALNAWLYLAFFGLGVLLWGLLFGRWHQSSSEANGIPPATPVKKRANTISTTRSALVATP
ncbi:hypothetical protein OG585_51550 (plasmid) [Streptomyces sp. NBC_01340]|uniref:hypothetical protein n=1 Tax=unclassified Streptomyces TaxID=2593676 RepID=UPI002257A1A8|nr:MULTISPECIES: hypothetical protein [unclassified Streptomyces]MCX4460447.1 hypothetical protein [Streptomyces sp. NBC_01719]MCX4500223.1 hypothetical protein [Streptomyces sp. NBC_01728]WSI45989.1 hypothetical protein OG585_51550 [Streptomyces sp. NBC_01340]